MHLHLDAQPGDRVFWFTTTGWMMWNFLARRAADAGLDRALRRQPGPPRTWSALWDLADEAGITTFGTSAAFIASCMKEGVEPGRRPRPRRRSQAVGSTGSPLSPEGFAWVYEELGADTWLFSTSGGTDVCTAFVGGVPTLPVYEGELQAPLARRRASRAGTRTGPARWSARSASWSSPSRCRRCRSSSGATRTARSCARPTSITYPGVWRHGDWIEITERGTAIIYGRSDSTINRGGVRMGTSEIYRAVLSLAGDRRRAGDRPAARGRRRT